MEGNIREQIAEALFPFEVYLSGKFNHSDIIKAMCDMAEVFESVYAQSVINHFQIKSIRNEEAPAHTNQ